jgi:hypothetical protein
VTRQPRVWPLVALPLIALLSRAFTFAGEPQQVESAEPRKIRFSGYTWEVKSSAAKIGPAPTTSPTRPGTSGSTARVASTPVEAIVERFGFTPFAG